VLIGKSQRHVVGAIAKLKQVVEPANRVSRSASAGYRAKAAQYSLRRAWGKENIRRRSAAQAHVSTKKTPRTAMDVEDRSPMSDQFQLAQERSELAGRVFPSQGCCSCQDSASLGIASPTAKVACQPRPQPLGFADVNQLPVGPNHPVNAGTLGAA